MGMWWKVLFSFYTEGNGSPERLHCWLKVTQPGVDSNFLDSWIQSLHRPCPVIYGTISIQTSVLKKPGANHTGNQEVPSTPTTAHWSVLIRDRKCGNTSLYFLSWFRERGPMPSSLSHSHAQAVRLFQGKSFHLSNFKVLCLSYFSIFKKFFSRLAW